MPIKWTVFFGGIFMLRKKICFLQVNLKKERSYGIKLPILMPSKEILRFLKLMGSYKLKISLMDCVYMWLSVKVWSDEGGVVIHQRYESQKSLICLPFPRLAQNLVLNLQLKITIPRFHENIVHHPKGKNSHTTKVISKPKNNAKYAVDCWALSHAAVEETSSNQLYGYPDWSGHSKKLL